MSGPAYPPQETDHLSRQYRTLFEVSESIVSHRELAELFHDLAPRLHRVIEFDFINLILHEPERNVMRSHVLESPNPNYACPSGDCPMETSGGWVWQSQQPWVVSAIERDTRFPEMTQWLADRGIKSLCVLPITTALRKLGALAFGSTREGAYSEPDVEFLQQVVRQVAVAVDNALNYQSSQAAQEQLQREHHIARLLLDVNNAVVAKLDLRELFTAITACLHRAMQFAFISLSLYDPENNQLRIHALDFPEGRGFLHEDILLPLETAPSGMAFASRKPVLLRSIDPERFPAEVARILTAEGIKSTYSIPMISHGQVLGVLTVGSLHENAFAEEDASLLTQVANQIAIAVENALAYRQIAELKNKLVEEKRFLEEEIKTEYNFEEIVGQSKALKRVLKQAETVAPTDSTVLILGETGTGKELIARAIHNLGRRRERTFVKINCAAIPTGLLESELFGHERGAFTGAIAQKIGRFELAHLGTLFLDEVGDIPLELQPKLLRVLQEQEFERLGSAKTIRVNVRLIAATNANLEQMVAEKRFRGDLYYRLNVFPVSMPPLRERREDIPLLVRYFAQKYGRLMKKDVRTVPAEVISAVEKYHWPGNIRELENFIERAVILSPGPDLRAPLGELKPVAVASSNGATTLETAEREHILKILKESNWIVGGPTGAAARLGMKRTTLQSRMKNLGIVRPK